MKRVRRYPMYRRYSRHTPARRRSMERRNTYERNVGEAIKVLIQVSESLLDGKRTTLQALNAIFDNQRPILYITMFSAILVITLLILNVFALR